MQRYRLPALIDEKHMLADEAGAWIKWEDEAVAAADLAVLDGEISHLRHRADMKRSSDAMGRDSHWAEKAASLERIRSALALPPSIPAGVVAAAPAPKGVDEILSRDMPFGYDPATGFFHDNDGGAPASTVFYTPVSEAAGSVAVSDAQVERALDAAEYIPNPDNRVWMRKALEAALSPEADVERLPRGHTVLEQADMPDGRVSQTVRIDATGREYERVVHSDEAYGAGQ